MTGKTLDIIKKVQLLFTEKNLSLSVAESCTGGLISHYLTYLPGSSRFFEAGVITYSAASKKKILGVSPQTIKSHGVISRETAMEMADRMRLITGTDYALSTTGNLGPEALEGKATGLVFTGISREGNTTVTESTLKGNRGQNREEAALSALRLLAAELSERE